MEVRFLEKNDDYTYVLQVLLYLRDTYDLTSLSNQIQKQQTEGYQIVYVKSFEGILAAAGFYIGEKLAWGRHIYIDDLVTHPNYRSKGAGKFLIDWFKTYAIKKECQQIHLDSGVQRFPAHKFYMREDFEIVSHHFSITNIKAT